jgi:hypothetical protein
MARSQSPSQTDSRTGAPPTAGDVASEGVASEAVAYEDDFHAWCLVQAARLRALSRPGANDGLDTLNLAEEMEGLARLDRRAVKAHTRVLLAHLLKWQYQPERRTPSWTSTIDNARTEIADLLTESPSLARYADDVVAETYPRAVRDVVAETGLPTDAFPATCPYDPDDVHNPDHLPGDPVG